LKTTEKYRTMEKGQTNNKNGRPKGTPNRVTAELREWISNLIDSNKEQIEKDLMSIEPDKRLAMLEKLMQYVLPKQKEEAIEEGTNIKNALYDKFFNRGQQNNT
jgi:hypothetical protein